VPTRPSRFRLLPGGSLVALTENDKCTWRLYDWRKRQTVRRFAGHTGAINCFAFSPDGRFAATGGADKAVWVWGLQTGEGTALRGHQVRPVRVCISADGKRALSSDGRFQTLLWDVEKQSCPYTFVRSAGGPACAVSPDSQMFAVPMRGGATDLRGGSHEVVNIALANFGVPTNAFHWKVPPEEVSALVFAPRGRRVVAASGNGVVRLWDHETVREVWATADPGTVTTGLDFAPDGSRILADAGAEACVLDAADGRVVRRIRGTLDGPWTCGFGSTGGDVVALTWRDGRAEPLDVPAEDAASAAQPAASLPPVLPFCRVLGVSCELVAVGTKQARTSYHLYRYEDRGGGLSAIYENKYQQQAPITAFGAAVDGNFLITAGDDGKASVWNGATVPPVLHPVAVLPQDGRPLTAVAVTGDGKRAATARGRFVDLWYVPLQIRLGGFTSPDPVTALAFCHGGHFLALGTSAQPGSEQKAIIEVHDATSFQALKQVPAPGLGTVTALAFSRDPNFLVAGGTGPMVYCINRTQGQAYAASLLVSGPVQHVEFRALNGDVLFTGRRGAVVRSRSLERLLLHFQLPADARMIGCAFDQRGLVVMGPEEGLAVRRQVLEIRGGGAP
jgi:WD40 repeat protein